MLPGRNVRTTNQYRRHPGTSCHVGITGMYELGSVSVVQFVIQIHEDHMYKTTRGQQGNW
jgi:hypothetical protein